MVFISKGHHLGLQIAKVLMGPGQVLPRSKKLVQFRACVQRYLQFLGGGGK